MATVSSDPVGSSYEEFVRAHAEQFGGYLRGVLGHQAEGRGGRVAVEDTLQEALLGIYAQWPEILDVRDEERDRRLYRCLRDAASQALRVEHGRRHRDARIPEVVPFDFAALNVALDEQPIHERELTAAVLGAMVRDLAATERKMLDRGILIAGLRALTEREAVVLIAVDHLGWDQQELAERLGIGFSLLRQTLFGARKVFYALVRHAAGVEVDEQERAQLAAYLAGELTGAERREARRHLQHCRSCQALQREQRVFGRDAHRLLAPLPFIFAAKVLAKHSTVKATALGAGGTGPGLLGQAGAAKALAVVVGVLGTGVGVSAWLAEVQEHSSHHLSAPTSGLAVPAGMRRITLPTTTTTTASKSKASIEPTRRRHKQPAGSSSGASRRSHSASKGAAQPTASGQSTPSSSAQGQSSPPAASQQAPSQQAPSQQAPSSSSSATRSGEGEFFGSP